MHYVHDIIIERLGKNKSIHGGSSMGYIGKVWILDDEGLAHDKEIEIYEKNKIEYRVTTKDTFEKDLQVFGRVTDAIVAQVGFKVTADLMKQLQNCKVICTF